MIETVVLVTVCYCVGLYTGWHGRVLYDATKKTDAYIEGKIKQ